MEFIWRITLNEIQLFSLLCKHMICIMLLSSSLDLNNFSSVQFSRSVVSNSLQPHGLAARQTSLSIINSRSLLKLISIESVMPSNHLILCHPILLLPSIFSSIRAFSNESVLHSRVLEFQLQHSPSNEYSHSRKPSHRWACGEFWNLRRQHSREKKLKIHRIHA